jgi:FkbM family methyltransferase
VSSDSATAPTGRQRLLDWLGWRRRARRGLPGRSELIERYWAAVEPVLLAHPDALSRETAEAALLPWLRTVAFSRGPLLDGLPWMTFPAISFLETLLHKHSRVFEFGAGGSTIFFSSRVGELVSVEHDPSWFAQLQEAMKERALRSDLQWRGVLAIPVVPPAPIALPPSDPLSYTSSDSELAGLSFRDYATSIEEFPNRYFDLIVIDGRARPSCFLHAMDKVRFGGYIVLDNAERESYSYIEETGRKLGFEISEFWGPGPYNDYCWRTIFMHRGMHRLEDRYWEAVRPVLESHGESLSIEDARASLPLWLDSMMQSRGPLRDGWPRLPFPAIRFLEALLTPQSRVFEFGAGGSTVFFSSRVGELVTVEHDPYRYHQTEDAITLTSPQSTLRWRAVLAAPSLAKEPITLSPALPFSYTSSQPGLEGQWFYDYATLIEQYPDQYFDVIHMDGPARVSCFPHVTNKVRVGGYVILNDAQREAYASIEETARTAGFEAREFWGLGPYGERCWRTLFLCRKWFAVNDLDRQLARYLDFDNGTFLEAGANNGIQQSNTLYFESSRHWRGILVEPVPALWEACRQNRPLARVVRAALASPEQVPGELTLRYAGLMSTVKGGMHSGPEEDAHIDAGLRTQKLESYEVTAPTATLSGILDQSGLNDIDLLSLDVEGYEAQALSGLDLSRHRPAYILVEARYPEDVDAILLPHYEVIAQLSHHDRLYRCRRDG